MKRLGIYLTFDPEGRIDRYVGYFLRELRACVSSLAVVCNMEEIRQGEENIRPYADQVYFRKNIGFDAGGFKDALCDFIGWDTVLQYDELVLANDSMFGPFRPMSGIFEEMEQKPVDFWGLSKHGEYKRDKHHTPEHIQSFFLAIRCKMLHSEHFRRYWESMPYFASYEQIVREYELEFTVHFSRLGYTFRSSADNAANDSTNLRNNYCQFAYIPYDLIKRRNFPFLKRKSVGSFTQPDVSQFSFCQALSYIERETSYPIDLVWESLIHKFNVADLQKKLCLQYIISPPQEAKSAYAAILVLISHESSFEYVCEYLERLSGQYKVVICAEEAGLLEPYQDSGYECEEIPQQGFPQFLSGFHAYDYVCVLHDVDMTSLIKPSYEGKAVFQSIWENLVRDAPYVSGVIEKFEKNPRLGFLAPPQSVVGEGISELGRAWNGSYEKVCDISAQMGLDCNLSAARPPYRVTENFWIRGRILKKLERMGPEDIPLLPYLWSYLAQDAECYSGIVECAEYAAMNGINLQYYLEQICGQIRTQYKEFQSFSKLQSLIGYGALQDYCRKYARVYAYGTGVISEYFQDVLPEIEAYIVSDGQPKQDAFHGVPVKYLSEIELSSDCGVVLCLTKGTQEQVIKLLEARNYTHYFCV